MLLLSWLYKPELLQFIIFTFFILTLLVILDLFPENLGILKKFSGAFDKSLFNILDFSSVSFEERPRFDWLKEIKEFSISLG